MWNSTNIGHATTLGETKRDQLYEIKVGLEGKTDYITPVYGFNIRIPTRF